MTLNDLQAYMRTYLAEHGGDDHLLRSLLLSDFVQFIRRRQHAETRNAGSQDHAALPRVDTRGAAHSLRAVAKRAAEESPYRQEAVIEESDGCDCRSCRQQ
jgi:hypothetical protein